MPLGTPEREKMHLQPLRLQVKETCKHGSGTHAKQQKILLSATHPSLTKFQTKTLPAARVGFAASDAGKLNFLHLLLQTRVLHTSTSSS